MAHCLLAAVHATEYSYRHTLLHDLHVSTSTGKDLILQVTKTYRLQLKPQIELQACKSNS